VRITSEERRSAPAIHRRRSAGGSVNVRGNLQPVPAGSLIALPLTERGRSRASKATSCPPYIEITLNTVRRFVEIEREGWRASRARATRFGRSRGR
jgi:hypothetical protein